jgi:uncharacterized protein YkwD
MNKTKILWIATVLFCATPEISQAGGGGRDGCYGMDAEACETFSLTNVERLRYHLKPLSFLQACANMAQEQSDDMSRNNYFSHTRPATAGKPGESFMSRARRFGLERGVGENIAMTRTAVRAIDMWMKSPGHRRNILNPSYTHLGVGHRNGLYTQSFGR